MTMIRHPLMWAATLLAMWGIAAAQTTWNQADVGVPRPLPGATSRGVRPATSRIGANGSVTVVPVQYAWPASTANSANPHQTGSPTRRVAQRQPSQSYPSYLTQPQAAVQPWPENSYTSDANTTSNASNTRDRERPDPRIRTATRTEANTIRSTPPSTGAPMALGAPMAFGVPLPPGAPEACSEHVTTFDGGSQSHVSSQFPPGGCQACEPQPSLANCPDCQTCDACATGNCGVDGCVSAERTRQLRGVASVEGCSPEPHWEDAQTLPFEMFGPGEFIGPVRATPVEQYRVRVNDQIRLTYLLSRDELPEYRLQVGDKIMVESSSDENVKRDVEVMPDGRVSLYLLGYIHVAGQTIPEVAKMLNELYISQRLIVNPKVTVTGVEVNTRLKDVQATVDSRQGQGGTGITVTVMPDGTINLVSLPRPICCQGLTIVELQTEINARYREQVGGLSVTVALDTMADKYVYVMGEVGRPDRYQLQGPTRVSQALALAGGLQLSGNQRQIIIVRHTPQWGTIATKLDLKGFLLGKRPAPSDDVWVRDQDIIIVPKHPIQRANDLISMLFTNGLYAAVPELGGFAQTGLFGTGTLLGN